MTTPLGGVDAASYYPEVHNCRSWNMRKLSHFFRGAGVTTVTLGVAAGAGAITTDPGELALVDALVGPAGEHCEEAIAGGDYETIFICGDEFFEFEFNAVDGGGADVGDGGRYTRLPRADLAAWANQTPERATGPNAGGCVSCHSNPVGTSAGANEMNVIRDPLHSADPAQMIQRNTPHLMGSGALQRLAEEMTTELQAIKAEADATNTPLDLVSKGVFFGTANGDTTVSVEGIDDDLVVKPFQWKGNFASLRAFTLDAMNNEIGMNPTELVGDGVDGDGDGVVNEASVADITATVIYQAGQTRPHTEIELDALRQELEALGKKGRAEAAALGLPTLTADDIASINNGEAVFEAIGCTDCHKSQMLLEDTVYTEPSQHPAYNTDAIAAGLDPAADAVSFDLATDMLDNHVAVKKFFRNMANLEVDAQGRGIVRLYGDLKRHDMGAGLAENIDETGHGASVWMTKELWGVGQTAQYLHDGRATTIPEAILEHGGEAAAHSADFAALSLADQADLVRFLQNLVILKAAEE